MTRIWRALLKLGGVALGSAAVVRFGLPLVVAAGALALVAIGVICWAISDAGRSARLALLISAANGNANRIVSSRSVDIAREPRRRSRTRG